MLLYGNKIGTLRFNFTVTADMACATLTETGYLQPVRKTIKKGDIFLFAASLSSLYKKKDFFSLFLLNGLCLVKEGNNQILTNSRKKMPYTSGWLMAMSVSGM